MSAQFGIWTFNGLPIQDSYLEKVNSVISPYAPDGVSLYRGSPVTLAYHALHTTPESRSEIQPHICPSGAVIVWDGRLDNREELNAALGLPLNTKSTDVQIVATAFDLWGTDCFAKLIGDWAVTIWNETNRLLILAKDFLGIRPLFYSLENDRVIWSTVLDPLVTLSGKPFELNQEYVAGWLASYPAADITPYIGIHSVPPSSFVTVREEGHSINKYWDFDPGKRIVHASDGDYEEHFRTVFREAVRRRLRSDQTICGELSGGMDSPSIVCMADSIIDSAGGDMPRLDTLSFCDDSEPNANERPYFTKVEEKRGRVGCHINLTGRALFKFDEPGCFEALPSSTARRPSATSHQLAAFLHTQGIRVVLSGIGGDEVMGGVPTPTPELQDLLVKGQLRQLAHKLKLWALDKRTPWFHLFAGAVAGFLPEVLTSVPQHRRPAPWLFQPFVDRHRLVLTGFGKRMSVFGSLPSFQSNIHTLDALRRQFASHCLSAHPAHEKRYPFLDRTLLEFMFALPRAQVVRPGYRRSLMRRALAGIVPPEVLERRRKTFTSRGPRAAISTEWNLLCGLTANMASCLLEIVDQDSFKKILPTLRNSADVSLVQLMRTVLLEVWLRNVCQHHALILPTIKRLYGSDRPDSRLATTRPTHYEAIG
jgi:asparagine synthase (glutamine-hydrolysing)